jgi:hypothetical protein
MLRPIPPGGGMPANETPHLLSVPECPSRAVCPTRESNREIATFFQIARKRFCTPWNVRQSIAGYREKSADIGGFVISLSRQQSL